MSSRWKMEQEGKPNDLMMAHSSRAAAAAAAGESMLELLQGPPEESDPTLRSYFGDLNDLLNTQPQRKLEKLISKIESLKNEDSGSGDVKDPTASTSSAVSEKEGVCKLTMANKYCHHCIGNLQSVRENLLTSFMVAKDTAERGLRSSRFMAQNLAKTASDLMEACGDAINHCQRICENGFGLHVVVDFLRNPTNLEILDFSKTGRVPVTHFSCNEATSMCLTWLHTAFERKLQIIKQAEARRPKNDGTNTCIVIYGYFLRALGQLRDAFRLTTPLYRVLMYCNNQGKLAFQKYVFQLHPQEVHDMITELQRLRRQYDEITSVFERLGWSLADVWNRCTGSELEFESFKRDRGQSKTRRRSESAGPTIRNQNCTNITVNMDSFAGKAPSFASRAAAFKKVEVKKLIFSRSLYKPKTAAEVKYCIALKNLFRGVSISDMKKSCASEVYGGSREIGLDVPSFDSLNASSSGEIATTPKKKPSVTTKGRKEDDVTEVGPTKAKGSRKRKKKVTKKDKEAK